MDEKRQKLCFEFWDRKSFFKTEEYYSYVKNLINEKIKEDLDGGDITTYSLINENEKIKAVMIAREDGIAAGVEEISLMLNEEKVTVLKKDGSLVKNNDIILEIEGNARRILAYERTLLNIMQRMSGIATLTYNLKKMLESQECKAFLGHRKLQGNFFVNQGFSAPTSSAIKNNCMIAATRKTLFPLLDKKAVSVGQGLTHRLTLNDAVLIKHTHMKIMNNGFDKALRLTAKNDRIKYIELEIKNEEEALKAAEEISNLKSKKIFAIMFDNMEAPVIKKAIIKINTNFKNNEILFEASGGISQSNIEEYSKTGVDVISVGLITHSSKAFNMSLQVR